MGRIVAALALVVAMVGAPALASGGGGPERWYLDAAHGEPAARTRLFDGQPGIVLARTPRSQLFMAWRALHGRRIGRAVGETLMTACCTLGGRTDTGDETKAWREARQLLPGASPIATYLRLDRPGPDYTSVPTCYADAFDTAAQTLRERIARNGAGDPAVRVWLAAQDVVFAACGASGQVLPPLSADAPVWLAADHAYQAAALALYDRRFDDAAVGFAAIGRDPASPWRPWSPYLVARARFQAALAAKDPATYAAAHAAIAALAAAPAAPLGRSQLRGMNRALAFREHPAALKPELQAELDAPELSPYAATAFRDVADLATVAPPPAEMIAWMAALSPTLDYSASDPAGRARAAAMASSLDRWRASHDVAWLTAALSLADVRDASAPELVAAAGQVALGAPAGLSARYHLARLTLASAPPALNRQRLDEALARGDLTNTDRNLLRGLRAAVASNRDDFARFALRTGNCAGRDGCSNGWTALGQLDGFGEQGTQGFGIDAMVVIDRLPLAERADLAASSVFAPPLQLDLALTSWARAVQLQDDAMIDTLSRRLVVLLPAMASEFRRVATAPAGPDKRFAEFFILAKVPGIRNSFLDYTRPEGRVAQYGGYWTDWLILPRGARVPVQPPEVRKYAARGGDWGSDQAGTADVYCLSLCGLGIAPVRLPDFAAAAATRARDEQGALIRAPKIQYPPKPFAAPGGSVAAWNELLAYVRAHPRDPRAAEALHWLVHASRWGGSHDHSGRRAFVLLKARYPASSWARRNAYYYD